MKFDALAQAGFVAAEVAGDVRETGDTQAQGLMRNPSACLCELSTAAE